MARRLVKSVLLRSISLKNGVFRNIRLTPIASYSSQFGDNDDFVATGRQISSDLESLGARGFLRSLKAYNPPPDVNQQIIQICKEFIQLKATDNLHKFVLTDRVLRFKILTKCINLLNHDIPNSQLHKINSIGDIISFYNIPVNPTTSMDDFKTIPDLPPNLHIQHEYVRFHPETDTMFGGVSAFPGRSNIITGLKAKKKYKGFKVERPYDDV